MFPRKLHRYEVYGGLYAVCEIDTYAPQCVLYLLTNTYQFKVQKRKYTSVQSHMLLLFKLPLRA